MRANRHIIYPLFFLFLLQAGLPVYSQLGFDLNIKKPKEYEDRVLRSEKTDKKFNVPRRFVQNTVTHFNYAFNASNKINEVLDRAKSVWKDDYSKLLAFYNFSLDITAQDSIQLDSITYKASSGIALHDLRNDWVDNLYLLWGASYYLQKDFDSAYQMFQFINYAFAPKEKGGYYRTIGSARDGNSALSISTEEKGGIVRKTFSRPPSRNDAFIWQIRNYLAQDQFAEASSLIVTLRDDPAFPDRLRNDLHEVQAYLFYKQNTWDSAAWHLERALSNARTQQERARWEYLAGQLWERAGNNASAQKNYERSISRTTDLVMEIYARLAAIRTNKDGGESDIQKNVAELVKMAKRDKYAEYQDIIYYMAAQMQLEGNNVEQAMDLLLRCTKANTDNPAQKNKAFLQLADLSFARKEYKNAYAFYDSVKLDDPQIPDPDFISTRKRDLEQIVSSIDIIERQDSLQRIAALPEDERKDFVKKLVRQIRRQQGLKDDQGFTPLIGIPAGGNQPPATLFPGDNNKGDWYFYNSSARSRGQAEFKSRWGNRPNVDNWRRGASIINNRANQQGGVTGTGPDNNGTTSNSGTSFEDLYERLPLTEELMRASNDSIQQAMYTLGTSFIRGIEDCEAGTRTLEELRNRFPGFVPMDELLFSLYYCYNKNGDQANAAAIKKLLNEQHAASNFTTILNTGKDPGDAAGNTAAKTAYEKIYDLFIEGRFQEAVTAKNTADSLYGNSHWTPQLLYIEAVYYIRNRDDNKAKEILNNIINRFQGSPLVPRCTVMLDVLDRRAQIEEELRNLQVTRYQDSATATQPVVIPAQQPVQQPAQVINQLAVKQAPDSAKTAKVPPPVTAPKPDSVKKAPAVTPAGFSYKTPEKYYVVLLLNKVDPVFVNEARNAFFRYNREAFYNKTYAAEIQPLNEENKLLLISMFNDEQEALTYVEKTKPKTATEIIPWLKNGKYTFTIISEANLQLLKEGKDLEGYKRFTDEHWPGKF